MLAEVYSLQIQEQIVAGPLLILLPCREASDSVYIQPNDARLALLSDTVEMVLALVHPLLQVYTIPRTGQLAYVGHICNFRQKVSKFVSSLPVVPQDMPFVMIRPRQLGNRPTFKAPFKVEKVKYYT